jgi:hypothetical protein
MGAYRLQLTNYRLRVGQPRPHVSI